MKRWRGLAALITDTVDKGAASIERVHLETAARPFLILEQLPGIAAPASLVHQAHDLFVKASYGSVRVIARAAGSAAEAALTLAERDRSGGGPE